MDPLIGGGNFSRHLSRDSDILVGRGQFRCSLEVIIAFKAQKKKQHGKSGRLIEATELFFLLFLLIYFAL